MQCSIARTLDVVGEWWTLLIIRDLMNGNRRFSGLLDSLGISKKILTDRLETLLAEGIVKQVPTEAASKRLEYRLTQKGLELSPILLSLMAWGDKWAFKNKPPVLVTHIACGEVTSPGGLCDHCDEPLDHTNISVAPSKHMTKTAQARWQTYFDKKTG